MRHITRAVSTYCSDVRILDPGLIAYWKIFESVKVNMKVEFAKWNNFVVEFNAFIIHQLIE
jgi:hypothetical protein